MKHFAVSDLHGRYDRYLACIDYIKNQCREDYVLYFLGDAIDRGKDGFKVMLSLLNSPQVIYLKGNHEEMFVAAAKEYLDSYGVSFHKLFTAETRELMREGKEMQLYLDNGGIHTFHSWINRGARWDIVDRVDKLPYYASYMRFDMCHSGCSTADWNRKLTEVMTWDRSHYYYPWFDDRTLIFGHTPTRLISPYIDSWVAKEFFALGAGRKIDIDGACYYTGVVNLYDLDEDVNIPLYKKESDLFKE